VLVGEPGVGKTALLNELSAVHRVLRVSGVESEIRLTCSGLHHLRAPLLDRAERVPDPQRDARRTACGLTAGLEPDRFLIGLEGGGDGVSGRAYRAESAV
jgi:hypothetical protein